MPRIIPEPSSAGSGGSVISGPQTTFVYRPGGVNSGNVYSSWALLMLDHAEINGPKVIQIDDSVTSPAVIPAGSYNLDDTEIVGDLTNRYFPTVLQFADGVEFTELESFRYLEIRNGSTTPVFSPTVSTQVRIFDCIVSVLAGGVEIFSPTGNFDLVLDRTSFTGSNTILNTTVGTTTVWLRNQSVIGTNLFESSIGSTLDVNCVDPNTTYNTQVGILGTTSSSNLSEGSKVFYDNTVTGLTAENVQDAIDEIAGGGSVSGPGPTVTDKGIVTWNGTSGIVLQDSGVRHYGKSATDPTTPTPANGDEYYNTVLGMKMTYDSSRTKWLSVESATYQFGKLGNTNPGQYYQAIGSLAFSSTSGIVATHNGIISEISYTRDDSDLATFEITADGSTIIGATLLSAAISGSDSTIDGVFASGDILGVRNQLGGNMTLNVDGAFKVRWTV